MHKMNMVQAINLALDQAMAKDDREVALGQDIGVNGRVFRATDGQEAPQSFSPASEIIDVDGDDPYPLLRKGWGTRHKVVHFLRVEWPTGLAVGNAGP